jgi:serine/threonine-protein kinase
VAGPASLGDPGSARRGSPTRRCSTCGASYPLDFLVCPKDATSLEVKTDSDADPLIGEVLAGSFCITGLIGSGGMGRVYEAEHVRLPRRFAVKVMHGELAGHTEAMARFEREAQAVARVVNEHVLEVVDVVRSRDGRPCIVTELLQGEELGKQLERSGKLPLPTAIAVCRQVCRGLAAAHAAGVVHRDLKPSNLFLVKGAGGGVHVKILDFGVAKMTDGADLTRTGMVVGTPAFMAPEQARGSSDIDARADIYAVGAVLYRMLTGEPPFPDEDPTRTLTRLLSEDPRRPRSIDKTIPAGLEALIQRAMARAPKDRPESVEQLDALLATFDVVREESVRVITSMNAVKDVSGLGSMDTIAVSMESPANTARDETARARRARPVAMALAIAVSLCAGAAVLVSAAVSVRAIAGRDALDTTSALAIAGGATLATLLALLGTLRVLFRRWRSAPAIQRLGAGLRATMIWLFGSLGVLTLGWRGYTALGPPPPTAWLDSMDVGVVLAPTVLALGLLVLGLRSASRVS